MSDEQLSSAVTPSRKRVCDFLSECAEVKKRKRDLEPVLVKKRAELCRATDQIAKLKQQIMDLTRRLQAKEVVADGLNAELATLITEWNSSTD
jgi:uncharacterized protein involved in exopolysaccharide biosynthesis